MLKCICQRGAALRIAAVILFERYEQKDKSGKPDRRERPNQNEYLAYLDVSLG